MDFATWEPIYRSILKDFGFKREEDERSASILSGLLEGRDPVGPKELLYLIQGKLVYVLGDAERLEKDLLRDDVDLSKGVVICADGTTSALLKRGLVPDLIVTDLDGVIEDQISANERGSIVAIHAHGDNIKHIWKWTLKFEGKLLGTVQCEPFGNLHNFGGFTDGDRAVFLAKNFQAKSIELLGFDFEDAAEKKNRDKETKLKKLKWAKELIISQGIKFE
jgi:uncharacterized Rossmann fold enzyme